MMLQSNMAGQTMFDPRVNEVDAALQALADAQADDKVALWDWACREMLHETQTGMHQLSCMAGIAETVAAEWRAPVDVIEPAKPYMHRGAFADLRIGQVLDALDGAEDPQDRAQCWRARYAALIGATLQGMRAIAGKHSLAVRAPGN